MRIAIRQRLRPFSLQPGCLCMIPLTTWRAQVFPTKAFLRDLASDAAIELPLPFGGKLDGFKVTLDLDQGRVEVSSRGQKPVYLLANSHEKLKKESLHPSKKRLFLGRGKKQDWDLMLRRCEMAELFPLWLKLSEWIPQVQLPKQPVGSMRLLELDRLKELFLVGFEGLLCPSFSDPHHLGLIEDEAIPPGSCPIGLIHAGAQLIESLFFREEGCELHLLPALPPAFHAGRLIHLKTSYGDRLDLEWSKKTLKKVVLHPASEREVTLRLHSCLKSFRLRADLRLKGEQVSRGTRIILKPNQTLYCDRFSHS